jgi:DNA-binding GntR family transcriptional regulator
MIRARDEERVVNAIEQHLAASYARVLGSYPDKAPAPELRLLR